MSLAFIEAVVLFLCMAGICHVKHALELLNWSFVTSESEHA